MKISHPLPQQIGTCLKDLRKSAGVRSAGLSLEQAARAVGISPSLLSGIENGASKGTPFTTVVMLCRLYGLHPCGLTTLYPALGGRQERAIEHFWTVLDDKQREHIAGQIELLVADNIDDGELNSDIVMGNIAPLEHRMRLRNHVL